MDVIFFERLNGCNFFRSQTPRIERLNGKRNIHKMINTVLVRSSGVIMFPILTTSLTNKPLKLQ